MADELTRAERDRLVQEVSRLDASLAVLEGPAALPKDDRARANERLFATLSEYADRLPRTRLSVCPFCEAPLKRVFDPFGMDGPWWRLIPRAKYEEPKACEHFRVLLGAVHLGGRQPSEVIDEVRPGPEPPFVVPVLLSRPGMICVVGRVPLASGDLAYPLAYFADQPTPPTQLHQPWLRNMFWFKTDEGRTAWSTVNYVFDFELQRWIENGQLRWTLLEKPENRVYGSKDGPCPFLNLPGERTLQQLVGGRRDVLGLPTGAPLNPFDEGE